MSISPRSPETSSTGEHYDRAALSDGVTAVTGVMDFLRFQDVAGFRQRATMKTLPPFGAEARGIRVPGDDVEWSSRQRGAHRAPG
jgi:hypothetical protein